MTWQRAAAGSAPGSARSVHRAHNENGGIRAETEKPCASRHEQAVKLWHEKGGAGAGGCLERLEAATIAGALLLPGIHAPAPAAHIDAPPPCIEKNVIRVPARGKSGDWLSGVHIENDEARRIAENHRGAAVRRIKRHREVGAEIRHLPGAYLPATVQIHTAI